MPMVANCCCQLDQIWNQSRMYLWAVLWGHSRERLSSSVNSTLLGWLSHKELQGKSMLLTGLPVWLGSECPITAAAILCRLQNPASPDSQGGHNSKDSPGLLQAFSITLGMPRHLAHGLNSHCWTTPLL